MLEPYLVGAPLPIGWITAAVATRRTLLDNVATEEESAQILSNLSNDLARLRGTKRGRLKLAARP